MIAMTTEIISSDLPLWFWVFIALCSTSLMLYILKLLFSDQRELNKTLVEAVNELTAMVKIHEHRLNHLEGNGDNGGTKRRRGQ